MSTQVNAALGIIFVVLSFAATFSMYRYWGYPYDKEKRQSSCPQWKMNIHRGIGFAYLAVYILLMIEMVPRMWTYQVEFPARTVAHLLLGMTIGAILIVKLSILRFFRHLEEWMPVLGTILFVATILLAGLSLPFVLAERSLAASAAGDGAVSDKNRERVRKQLAKVDDLVGPEVGDLGSRAALLQGRQVLLTDCVYCHDLKTAIAKPRTPVDWWRTVRRMASKPSLGEPLSMDDQRVVTAYLVAISPVLQDSVERKREESQASQALKKSMEDQPGDDSLEAVDDGAGEAEQGPATSSYSHERGAELFDDLCTQCHGVEDVDEEPPSTRSEARELIRRMIEHGLEAEKNELRIVEEYLVRAYVQTE